MAAATPDGFPKTSYVAVTGADSTDGPGNLRGIIGLDRGLRFNEITDGLSNTILVAEVADGGPWFAGGTATARRIDDWIVKKTWSPHGGGGNVLFGDASVQFVSSTIDPRTLRHLATAQGGEPVTLADGAEATVVEAPASRSASVPSARPVEGVMSTKQGGEANRSAPQLPPPPAKPLPQIPSAPRSAGGERARLSLGVTLEPLGEQAISFRHDGGLGELVLGLQDRTFANTLQWFIVAAVLLAAWIWRRSAGLRRTIAVVMGLAAPIGLSGLVPLAWTPLLDGLLLGTLAGVCLWILLKIIAAIKPSLAKSSAVAAIGLGLLFAADATKAADTHAADGNPTSTGQVRQPDLTLLIPYDPDNEKPLKNTQVYLPHDEFLRLWKQAHPNKQDRAPANVRAIVSRAEYSGRIENDIAHIDGRLLVDQFVDGWTPVALPLGKVAFEKIEINGRPATLAEDGRDQPVIYLNKPGPHVVDVRFSVPVSRLGATGRMTVPLRPVSSGRLLLQLPANDLEVQVIGAPGGWRRQLPVSEGKGGKKATGEFVSISLGAANELGIRWQPRRVEAREGQLVSVDQSLLVEVLDSGVHFHSKFRYRIQQGSLGKLRFRIPPDMAIQAVHGAEVADWSIETEPAAGPRPEAQELVVSLKAELTGGTEVDIRSFRRDHRITGNIDIHSLEPLGVVRETGRVAIGCSGHFRVHVDKTDGVDQIDRTGLDLPREPSDGCALLWAYRYTSRPWQLQLQVERHRPRLEVSDSTAVAVTAHQAALRSLLTADVTGTPILSFGIRLPASLRVSQVRVPPGADWFVSRDGQGQLLKVELSEPAIGRLDLAVCGTLARDPGQAEFAVPGVIVEEAQAQRGQLSIYLDDDLQAVLTNQSGAWPIDPAALHGALRPDRNRSVRYAFQYDSPPENLRLRLSSAPSLASADVTTIVSVREGGVAYIGKVDFDIRQAGRSRFRLATPEWLGEDVELRGEQIRQIRSQLTDGRRIWEIELQQPARGTYCLHLTQTLPLPDDGTVPAVIIQPLDVERLRSHIVLENATVDEIAETTTRGATPIPIAAVPAGLADNIRRQAIAAYRIADADAALAWQRRVRQQETGLTASISLCDLTTVIHADGRYRASAAYNIRNFTLQFLELEMPPDSEIWSVHVSGQPVHPAKIRRQGRPVTLLPLLKTSLGDFSSKVVVIYAGHLGEPLSRWTQVRPPAPQILSNVPVSRTLWTVLMPREYKVSLVDSESNLEEVVAAYQQEERKLSFLDELRQVVQVAGGKGQSAAQTTARYNLQQVGAALHNYAQQSTEVSASNAADVQGQAQQIQAEIGRLEESKSDATRADDGTTFYFAGQPRRELETVRDRADLYRDFEKLPELDETEGRKAEPSAAVKKLQNQDFDRPEQLRGELRKQAAEQLARLRVLDRKGKEPVQPSEAAVQEPAKALEGKPETTARVWPPAAGVETGEKSLHGSQAAPAAPAAAAGTGRLSLDLDVTPVGIAYHFRKLHGEPRLVLRARHEDLGHSLSAIIWAGVCLALAAAVIHGLGRPDALGRVRRYWPWLAAIAGTVWLFLLPAGAFGLVLLATALCALTDRMRKRQTTGSEIANGEQKIS